MTSGAPGWLLPGNGTEMPDSGATWDTWAEYALGRGMPPGMADELTRDQIRVIFCPPGSGPVSRAVLDRHDRDRAAVSARHEARRRPWEQ